MEALTKKHKTFNLTSYHRDIELVIICVTTSKKKFAELTNKSVGYINDYAVSYDLRYPVCNENPEKLYAKPGIGGEAMFIFNKDEIKTLEEYEALINQHKEKFPTARDYYDSQK
jgi:hypothetical protein